MPSQEAKETLLKVLEETRELLTRPDNDFAWSSWNDSAEALKEMDGYINAIRNDQKFDIDTLWVRFAPTGSIQEVSFSGWALTYLKLAERFDEAIKAYQQPDIPPPKPPATGFRAAPKGLSL